MFRVTLSAKALLTALSLTTFAATPGGAADPASPVGKWQTTSGESRYEVSICGENSLCARLTWLRADARTPENLAHLNTYVVKGARQTSPPTNGPARSGMKATNMMAAWSSWAMTRWSFAAVR